MPVPDELIASAQENGKKKVLIVDDDKEMMQAIKRILMREKNFLVETADDGFEAGRKFSQFEPDLIILDIRMPGFDGYQVCSYIRKDLANARVKILAISGISANAEGARKIIRLGADDYLAKPFSNEELKMKISFLLGQEKRGIYAR
jgi:DNA-binding response OmpR family regulator